MNYDDAERITRPIEVASRLAPALGTHRTTVAALAAGTLLDALSSRLPINYPDGEAVVCVDHGREQSAILVMVRGRVITLISDQSPADFCAHLAKRIGDQPARFAIRRPSKGSPLSVHCPACRSIPGLGCDARTLGRHTYHRARVDLHRESSR